jgi:hypothetical protein
MIYDVVIVGAGIAGLYSAYKLKQKIPGANILIVEKNEEKYLGGRAGTVDFHGVPISPGAGVGRKQKDKLLIKLLKELHIKYGQGVSKTIFSSTVKNPVHLGKIMMQLKKAYKKKNELAKEKKNQTFKDFATKILGCDLYQDFLVTSAYTDYENEDAYDVLYNYGMDDNEDGWTALYIPWKKLIDALANKCKIKFSCNVTNIEKRLGKDEEVYVLDVAKTTPISCRVVIVATTITSVRHLFPKHEIYKQIYGQPFLRVYGKFSESSIPIMKNIVPNKTVVPGPVHRIINIDENKGVYMIVYTDNAGAEFFNENKQLKNTAKTRDHYSKILDVSLGLPSGTLHLTDIITFYWQEGTHYYEPLHGPYQNRSEFVHEAQHPMPNVYVVGEMISEHQGWVEGTLESVEAVL